MIEKIRPINLPKINPMETESVPKKQSLKEWAMAGGGVPTQYKGREHVWHGKVKRFAEGGGVHMAGGGMIGKLAKGVIGKAAEAAGMKAPVTAAKDLTTVQDFHTSLGDRVRQRAAEMQDLTESMPFKYDKGQRVFTESSSKKNKPPYTILNRMPFGNSPMRADHPELGPRMGAFMKDPETGKTMRSPYEPGYKVRQEDGEQWSEFTIPESAIKGDVEMAKGGAAFGVFPQMTGKRSKQDPEAAKNMPVDFARGVVSGVLGAPGDIESLVRMIPGLERSRGLGDLVTGNHRETYLPTSEEIEKRIPLRSDTPQSRGASGLGILSGGFYMGPGAPMRLVGGVPTAVYKAGKDFAQAAGQPATKIGPSRLSNVKEAIRQSSGDYAARRLERAADEIPNLEKLYKEDAIRRAFTGDNAKAVATINPKDFQKYAIEVQKRANVGPQAEEMARKGDISKGTVSTDEYIKHLQRVKGGFDDVPFLQLFKDEVGVPSKPRISGHEGRHRNMAMAENQEPAGLVQVFTRGDLREGLPRRHQDEYINALREELDLSGNLVFPESSPMYGRPPVNFPDVYAKGGAIHMAGGGAAKKVVEGAVKGVKKLLGMADEAPKGVEPIVVKTKVEPENYSQKVLDSTAARIAEKIAVANPKMKAEEVAKKAMNQATKKLDWERTQKPALEKRYGALAKSSYAESNPQKQQNTPEVVKERIRKANEFLDQPTEPWTPPRPELQAFDRSAIKDALEGFPGVEQSRFPRDTPSRANIEHVEGLYTDPVNRALIEKQIKRGLPLGGESFYASLYPVKQAVLEAGMPPEKFEKWIHSLAPASARNSIMNEMAAGQFLRDMNARGIKLTEENVAREMALYKEKFGIGLPLMPLHREGVAKVLEGGQNLRDMSLANIPTNYKIPTYGSQKAGDFAHSVVLDVHEAGGQTQGSRFHPYFNEQGGFGNTEYNAGEQGMLGIAKDLGIPGGMAQAGRWFGGGELTGLRSPRGDALDLLEKQVAFTLKQKGTQPNPANVRAEILRQIETGEGDLLPYYRKEGMPDVRQTGLQRAEGGEVNLDDPSIKKHQPLNIMFGKKPAQQHKRGGLPSIK